MTQAQQAAESTRFGQPIAPMSLEPADMPAMGAIMKANASQTRTVAMTRGTRTASQPGSLRSAIVTRIAAIMNPGLPIIAATPCIFPEKEGFVESLRVSWSHLQFDEQSAEATRVRILMAARTLFARRGIDAVTIAEIYRMLVQECDWSPDCYQAWLSETLVEPP